MEERGREGEGREERGRRGIIIGGMVIGLLLGCNNGGEDPQKVFLKSVVSLGNEFLNIFTSFTDVFSSSLGFKKDPKKSDVGNYFDKLKETVQGTKEKLEKIVADMEKDNNLNVAAVKTKVDELIKNKLDNIIDGAKTASEAIGSDAGDPIGNVPSGTSVPGVVGDIDKLVNGIKLVVDVVLKDEGKHTAGDSQKAKDSPGTRTGGNAADAEAGKFFATSDAGNASNARKAAADAAKAVGAVSGADILKAISIGDAGGAFKLANAKDDDKPNTQQDAVIAGAIALRAMAKSGKFASPSASAPDAVTILKGTAISAVTKALGTLTMAIRKTIDEGLKTVKEAMKINPETTPVTTEAKN